MRRPPTRASMRRGGRYRGRTSGCRGRHDPRGGSGRCAADAVATHAPAREAWWRRWQPMAAAAGVVGLAFVLVQMLPRNEPLQSPAAPTPQPLPESAARQSTAESRAAVPASPAPAAPSAPSAPSAPAAPAELAAPSAAAAPATEAPQKAVRRELAGNGVSADMATATTADAGMQPAEAWVRLIVDLHAAGDDAAAAAELRAFRAAYPDADSACRSRCAPGRPR